MRLNEQTDWTEKRPQDGKKQPIKLIKSLQWEFIEPTLIVLSIFFL